MPTAESVPQGQPAVQEQPTTGMPPAQDQASSSAPVSQEPPATYDQLKWPDSIELNEDQGDIVKSDDPNVIALSKKASQLSDQLKEITNKIKAVTDKVNQDMTRINGVLDAFYQKVGFDEGKAKAMLK